jgi:Holliday junction DNA helicase RuvB
MAKDTIEDYATLRKIADYEDKIPEERKADGWEWFQVAVYSSTLNRFLVNGWVKIIYKSTKHTHYLLTETGRQLATSEPTMEEVVEEKPILDTSILFQYIVGYDKLKELLRESLQLDKPIHVLMWGPPSIAKTLFLLDIEKAGGDAAMWLIGSATSRAGLWDAVANRKPRWLLVDELDKMTAVDQSALLSIMERGRIVRTKVGRELDETVNCWVVGTANRIGKMPPELLSRFAVYQLGVYTPAEYYQVVKNVLVNQEGMSEDDALKVAEKLLDKTHDVREAIRVARLSKRVGVDRAAELLIRT